MTTITQALDQITTAVTAETAEVAVMKTSIAALRQQIADLQAAAGTLSPDQDAALSAALAAQAANTADIAHAVA